MTIVVLLILAGIWAAVLVPPLVRARAENRPADSIGDFRRQLGVLQRTGPISVAPANRLRVGPYAPGVHTPASLAVARAGSGPGRGGAQAGSQAGAHSGAQAARRARTLKRRRDVLFTLAGAAAGTLVLGLLPPLRMLWLVHLFVDIALAAYVALLVRMRNAAAEREMKLRFLPGHAAVEPVALRVGSAN